MTFCISARRASSGFQKPTYLASKSPEVAVSRTACSEIFSGVLAPEALEGETHVDSELAEELEQHKGRIWDVQVLICVETDDPAIKEIYDFALHSLQDIFDEVYRLRAAGQHGVNLMHLVIGWLYRISD
ncbi:hypothetical protein KXV95_007577 [Aspergillus fumigatus]|nr:hypothetical protein KXV95_007577 [Aspergillus fumigatus]